MKKLTIKDDFHTEISLENFEIFEKKYLITFPENLKKFISDYNGSTIFEDIYFSKKENLFFPIQRLLFLTSSVKNVATIEGIYEGHLEAGFKNFIPFTIDSGGWDYNISTIEETYGQIFVNRFDDNEENPFNFVAPSLEEFINGLITEEEAVKLGY